jgi:hypothetical protein
VGRLRTDCPASLSACTADSCSLPMGIHMGRLKWHGSCDVPLTVPPGGPVQALVLQYDKGPDWHLDSATLVVEGIRRHFSMQRRVVTANDEDLVLNGEPYKPQVTESIKEVFPGEVFLCIHGIMEDLDRKMKNRRERRALSAAIVRCRLNERLRLYYAIIWARDSLDVLIAAVLASDGDLMGFVDAHDYESDRYV